MVMAASDETISASVFVSLVSGMERLVMTDRLTRQDATVLVKASTARSLLAVLVLFIFATNIEHF